jgi:hypothetical protein
MPVGMTGRARATFPVHSARVAVRPRPVRCGEVWRESTSGDGWMRRAQCKGQGLTDEA